MKLVQFGFQGLGSRCEFKLYFSKHHSVTQIQGNLQERLRQFETKYSRYVDDSVVSQINSRAFSKKGFSVDEETLGLLNYAASVFEQSEGLFDITSGVLRQIWKFKQGCLPTEHEIENVLPKIGWQKVEWKPPVIRFLHPGMEIDFGGFGKEYASDMLVSFCRELGIQHGLVNLGGDISIVGPHPSGAPWQIGIQHPRAMGKAIAKVELASGGIATSGDYERFMIVNGKRYSHLLNPLTGQSIQPAFSGVSVIAPHCLVAGSFSTIAMLLSERDAKWLSDAGLPYLTIDQQMNIGGTVDLCEL